MGSGRMTISATTTVNTGMMFLQSWRPASAPGPGQSSRCQSFWALQCQSLHWRFTMGWSKFTPFQKWHTFPFTRCLVTVSHNLAAYSTDRHLSHLYWHTTWTFWQIIYRQVLGTRSSKHCWLIVDERLLLIEKNGCKNQPVKWIQCPM